MFGVVLAAILMQGGISYTAEFKPGDVILVKVYRHPEYSDTFLVDVDTTIYLPLIGNIKVSHLTAKELRDTLYVKFSKFLKKPEIDVIPLFRINILGQVRKPGVYNITSATKVTDAIALAGGLMPDADPGRAIIRRGSQIIKIDIDKAITQEQTAYDVGLRSGDIIYIPRKRFKLSLTTIYTILSTISLLILIIDRLNQ